MKDKLGKYLQYIGYIKADTTLPEFSVYFVPDNGNAEVVLTIDYEKEIYLSQEIYKNIREKFVQLFVEKGFQNVHVMTLVLCQDLERMASVFENDIFTWYLQINQNELYIPQGHVENFYGIKGKIEEFISNPEKYEELYEINCIENASSVQKKRFVELPFINASIVIINILVFILCTFTQELLYNKGAFSFFLVEESGEYYRYVTNMFLHQDVDHIFSNMLLLCFLGNKLEMKIGHIRYILLYFMSGIIANIASAVYEANWGYAYASIGASGAVFGVIGAALVLIYAEGGSWKDITLPRMLLMIAYSVYSGFMASNVNNVAHLGGLAAGIFIMTAVCIIKKFCKKKEVLHEN